MTFIQWVSNAVPQIVHLWRHSTEDFRFNVTPDQATTNLLWADALIAGLAASGVQRAVISPGSRSTPLVLACNRHPDIQSWMQIDERSAAFFALGLARYDQSPVLLIATSGSAPAHWYPAVIEAYHSGVPLILLSADRPPELQNCGANQTTDQSNLFGSHTVMFHDPGPAQSSTEALASIHALGAEVAAQSQQPRPGPVHINLPLREPLVPQKPPPRQQSAATAPPKANINPIIDQAEITAISQRIAGRPGLLLCGPIEIDAAAITALTALAKQLQVPLLADPLSNLRFGRHDRSHLICRYDSILRRSSFTAVQQPEWLIQFGATPVSTTLLNYLKQCQTETILVNPYGCWFDPIHQATSRLEAAPADFCNALIESKTAPAPPEWLATFRHAEKRAIDLLPTADGSQPTDNQIITELLTTLPNGTILFSSNSLPIRHLDSWSGSSDREIRIVANRGVSGIDGNISTLLGLTTATNGPVVGLLGDLALYHDMNGLLAATGLDGVIILLNNGGGGIFGYLPQAELDGFSEQWLTPTGLDFSHVARLYQLNYQRVEQQRALQPALERALTEPGVSLVEIVLEREQNMLLQQEYWRRVAAD